MNEFEVGKKYKVKTTETIYTATILEVTDLFVIFVERTGIRVGVNKKTILDFKELNDE